MATARQVQTVAFVDSECCSHTDGGSARAGGHWICKPPWKPEPWSVVQGKWQLVPGKGGDGS